MISLEPSGVTWSASLQLSGSALEATQGQMNGFLSQIPYKCRLEEVASMGDYLKICPQLDFKAITWSSSRRRRAIRSRSSSSISVQDLL